MHFSRQDHQLFDDLSWPLDFNNADSSLWNYKCDYYDTEICTDLNLNKYNLVILQLNIRSLLAHELELKIWLNTLNNKNSPVDAILPSEIFLTRHTEMLVNVPGYTLITNFGKDSKGVGVGILIKNSITYKHRQDTTILRHHSTQWPPTNNYQTNKNNPNNC